MDTWCLEVMRVAAAKPERSPRGLLPWKPVPRAARGHPDSGHSPSTLSPCSVPGVNRNQNCPRGPVTPRRDNPLPSIPAHELERTSPGSLSLPLAAPPGSQSYHVRHGSFPLAWPCPPLRRPQLSPCPGTSARLSHPVPAERQPCTYSIWGNLKL